MNKLLLIVLLLAPSLSFSEEKKDSSVEIHCNKDTHLEGVVWNSRDQSDCSNVDFTPCKNKTDAKLKCVQDINFITSNLYNY